MPTESPVSGLRDALGDLGGQWLALLLDPSERTYWVFLLAAVVIAVGGAVLARPGRRDLGGGRGRERGWAWAVTLRRYVGASARVDYLLILSRPVIFAVFALPWALSAFGLAMAVVRRLDAIFGVPAAGSEAGSMLGSLGSTAVAVLYSLVLFVAWDLSRYLLHRLMHASPLLWELHQVHHSATDLTPFTLYRVHPIESALYRLRGVLVTGLVTGLFFHLFRAQAVQLELLGVGALGFAFSLLGGNLRHSHVWWSWGRLERWFVSPAQHQLHHAREPGADRCNYGTWLAVWDRLGGTLRCAGAEPPAAVGLSAHACNHDPASVLSALFDPVWAVARRLARGLRARWVAPAR